MWRELRRKLGGGEDYVTLGGDDMRLVPTARTFSTTRKIIYLALGGAPVYQVALSNYDAYDNVNEQLSIIKILLFLAFLLTS